MNDNLQTVAMNTANEINALLSHERELLDEELSLEEATSRSAEALRDYQYVPSVDEVEQVASPRTNLKSAVQRRPVPRTKSTSTTGKRSKKRKTKKSSTTGSSSRSKRTSTKSRTTSKTTTRPTATATATATAVRHRRGHLRIHHAYYQRNDC
jgi:polyhydroxyalkanoate synthesis regulator phasin